MALGNNIKSRREVLGWSPYELAERAGLKQSSIWRIEAGQTRPRPETLKKLAEALSATIPELEYGLAGGDVLPLGTRRIPVLDYVQAGAWTGVAPTFRDDEMQETTLTNAGYSPDAFAMKVRGESMSPGLLEGDIITVDPAVSPRPGDIVVAVDAGGTATVKQFKSVGLNAFGNDIFELRPFNDLYPTLRSDITEIRVVGTVVAYERRFRSAKKH